MSQTTSNSKTRTNINNIIQFCFEDFFSIDFQPYTRRTFELIFRIRFNGKTEKSQTNVFCLFWKCSKKLTCFSNFKYSLMPFRLCNGVIQVVELTTIVFFRLLAWLWKIFYLTDFGLEFSAFFNQWLFHNGDKSLPLSISFTPFLNYFTAFPLPPICACHSDWHDMKNTIFTMNLICIIISG